MRGSGSERGIFFTTPLQNKGQEKFSRKKCSFWIFFKRNMEFFSLEKLHLGSIRNCFGEKSKIDVVFTQNSKINWSGVEGERYLGPEWGGGEWYFAGVVHLWLEWIDKHHIGGVALWGRRSLDWLNRMTSFVEPCMIEPAQSDSVHLESDLHMPETWDLTVMSGTTRLLNI